MKHWPKKAPTSHSNLACPANLVIYSTIHHKDPLVLLIGSKKSLWILADAQRSTKMRRQESETDLERSIGPSETLFDNVFEVHSLISVFGVDEV